MTWPRRNDFKLNLNYLQLIPKDDNVVGSGPRLDYRNVIDGPVYLVSDAFVPSDKILAGIKQEISEI